MIDHAAAAERRVRAYWKVFEPLFRAMTKKKMTKPQIKKSRKLAEKIKKSGSKVRNPFAVATAVVKRAAKKRAAKRKKR